MFTDFLGIFATRVMRSITKFPKLDDFSAPSFTVIFHPNTTQPSLFEISKFRNFQIFKALSFEADFLFGLLRIERMSLSFLAYLCYRASCLLLFVKFPEGEFCLCILGAIPTSVHAVAYP